MTIQEQVANLKAPKICVTISLEKREEELLLINYAKVAMAGGNVTRHAVMELLSSLNQSEQMCEHNCVTCKYFKACEHFMGMSEALYETV